MRLGVGRSTFWFVSPVLREIVRQGVGWGSVGVQSQLSVIRFQDTGTESLRLMRSESWVTSLVTAPESMVLAARAMPVGRSGARSAVTRTAAALRRTMSRRGLRSPAKMAVRIWALVRASPPCRVSMGARVRPTSSGVMVERVTMPLWTSAKWLGPEMENSSMPVVLLGCHLCRWRCLLSGFSVDDEGVAGVEEDHGFGGEGDEVRGVDAHDLGGGSGGVGEGADEMEDGADAEGAADGHDGLHGRVQAMARGRRRSDVCGGRLRRRRGRGRRGCRGLRGRRRSRMAEVTARLPCLATMIWRWRMLRRLRRRGRRRWRC